MTRVTTWLITFSLLLALVVFGHNPWSMLSMAEETTTTDTTSTPPPPATATPGEHFAWAVREREKKCAHYKPQGPGDVGCSESFHLLKPYDPLATPEGRFAHSIKLPEEGDKHVWRDGMTPNQYFDALCKQEAGEFIYKTVESVDGIVQLRPREHATDQMFSHLYAMEDPYGHTNLEADSPWILFINPPWRNYAFLETTRKPPKDFHITERGDAIVIGNGSQPYWRYFGYHGGFRPPPGDNRLAQETIPMKAENISINETAYGYTWRAAIRPHDRENGIAGSELIVLDLKTNEVLGVLRGYARTIPSTQFPGVWWGSGMCPKKQGDDFAYQFISKILKPTASDKQ